MNKQRVSTLMHDDDACDYSLDNADVVSYQDACSQVPFSIQFSSELSVG